MTADYGTSLLLDACLPRIDGRGFTKTAWCGVGSIQ